MRQAGVKQKGRKVSYFLDICGGRTIVGQIVITVDSSGRATVVARVRGRSIKLGTIKSLSRSALDVIRDLASIREGW